MKCQFVYADEHSFPRPKAILRIVSLFPGPDVLLFGILTTFGTVKQLQIVLINRPLVGRASKYRTLSPRRIQATLSSVVARKVLKDNGCLPETPF